MIDRSDPLWYKDAVVYQLHVKAYFDSNNDGVGDFAGLEQKLDYIKDLGVTAIWLLPFYPSPLRDDGYDIGEYRDIHPSYGKMADFKRFMRAAHQRGLRVITELVVNHTSDQHPWFQRARRAKPGSNHRNFYVWSDNDQKYEGTRIIFLDTEASNWSWDKDANAYYWHRFFSHQPDLNFDNPNVLREVTNVLHFWLELGVDGLRLDAVPYLIEREGTNNENLPETHAVLKKIRAEVDAHYSDRMLLAEANQWPEDTQEYFGDGDECHMAFNFPLMPRMYMAIAQEDRHPITDILRQMPDIPPACQWAVFLRNHDELTLEMVTDQERDYLWNFYAADRRMRINLGIRRRLAPLLENDRRKIELLNGLLMSMPGTPIIYYGDEIGMGDNIYVGDRDGVRTPMQWSPDRNGGFSRADPARLYLPPIMDAIYGYDSVNVEAQQRSGSSLLNWMKRMIGVRQMHKAFGRGTLGFLYPGNRKVLAYLREYDGETILCICNLSRSAQAVEVDLTRFKGRVPVELMGRSRFPPIGDLPYMLTLAGYGFHWFLLAEEAVAPRWHEPPPEALPELITLVMRNGWQSIAAGREADALYRDVFPVYMPNQRWFGAKGVRINEVRRGNAAILRSGRGEYLLNEVRVALADGDEQRYFIPLAYLGSEQALASSSPLQPFTVAKGRHFRTVGPIYDASSDETFPLAVVESMRDGVEVSGSDGVIRFEGSDALRALDLSPDTPIRRLGIEQSNSSIIVGDSGVLKIFRRLVAGAHPELEMGRFLAKAGYQNTPPFLGAVEHLPENAPPTALAVLQGFLFNQGDGWAYTLNYLDRYLDERSLHREETPGAEDLHGVYLVQASTLGKRTGELHLALASDKDDPDFRPEPIGKKDLAEWRKAIRAQLDQTLQLVKERRAALPEEAQADADALIERTAECRTLIDRLTAGAVDAVKTRLHGDYHLGQVLVVKDDFYILDFEGEPARSLEERRAKTSPLKDVAGMLRSFDYAAWAALRRLEERERDAMERARPDAVTWRDEVSRAFLSAYREVVAGSPIWPEKAGDAERLIDLYLIEKALYEIRYEAANRPAWLGIPVRGVISVLDTAAQRGEANGS